MTGLRTLLAPLAAALAVAIPLPGEAASFDCNRARSKLNRVICSDPALSRLDEIVWNAYGERIRGLTALQYASMRERHILWRRGRGLYETSVEALTHEYRSHLAWLNHPLLPLEGIYQRGDLAASAARFEAEVDLRSPSALVLRGLVTTPAVLAWEASGSATAQGTAATTATVPAPPLSVTARPALQPGGGLVSEACEFSIEFTGDEAVLVAAPACGKAFDGRYARTARQ